MSLFVYGAMALVGLLLGLWFYVRLLQARLEDADAQRDYADAQLAALQEARKGEVRIAERMAATNVRHAEELRGVSAARDREGLNHDW